MQVVYCATRKEDHVGPLSHTNCVFQLPMHTFLHQHELVVLGIRSDCIEHNFIRS